MSELRADQPELEAALRELVRYGVRLAEVMCGSFQQNEPTPAELDAIECTIVRELVDKAHRAMLANGTSEAAWRGVMPCVETVFRGAYRTRFRELAPLMTPTGSA
jgi:hypothetical protein